MADALLEAITGLQTAREEAAKRVHREQTNLAKIDEALARLKSDVTLPPTKDFAGLGIVEAAHRLLVERGELMSTKDIADELLARGVVTKSLRFVPTVYATLTNAKTIFVRKDDMWGLKPQRN